MIEDELRRIDMNYISSEYSEDDLAGQILSAAESIQELANNFGDDEVNLSPNIERLRELKTQEELNIISQEISNDQSFSSSSINAVPKTRLRSDQELFNTNSKRNTIGVLLTLNTTQILCIFRIGPLGKIKIERKFLKEI